VQTDAFEIRLQEPAGDLAQGRNAVVATFAAIDPEQAFFQVHVLHGQVAQLLVPDIGCLLIHHTPKPTNTDLTKLNMVRVTELTP